MEKYNLKKMQKKLKRELDSERYDHTLGVMYTCASLAMRYEYDLINAQVAGMLHDCAKSISDSDKILLCQENNIVITEFEQSHPYLIHAKLGAYLAKEDYDVSNKDILSAIEYHTTGKPDMSMLEKIVYLADYIEPLRGREYELAETRKMAFIDLDKAVYLALSNILCYLEATNSDIEPTTKLAYEYYKEVIV